MNTIFSSIVKRFFYTDYIKKLIYRITHWETWPWLVKYIPMIPFWILHVIKARSCWFFTAANPTLTFGGYEGEGKVEMYEQLPKSLYPKTTFVRHNLPMANVECLASLKGYSFPLAVKPNVGRMGLMFRKINSLRELMEYHERIGADYILQEFIPSPVEVSIFYYRYPSQKKGRISGFVRKDYLSVKGDGVATLQELMLRYQPVQFRLQEMQLKHARKLNDIIPDKETYVLSDALNLSRGGQLISLEHEKDERLADIIDNISRKANFYFGRYDIKCESVEALKKGNFSILEFNGAGAEPHHVYGNGNSFVKATKILLKHWDILYEISVENHKKGIPYWTFMEGIRHLIKARKHFQMLNQLEFSAAYLPSPTLVENLEASRPILQPIKLTVNN